MELWNILYRAQIYYIMATTDKSICVYNQWSYKMCQQYSTCNVFSMIVISFLLKWTKVQYYKLHIFAFISNHVIIQCLFITKSRQIDFKSV